MQKRNERIERYTGDNNTVGLALAYNTDSGSVMKTAVIWFRLDDAFKNLSGSTILDVLRAMPVSEASHELPII